MTAKQLEKIKNNLDSDQLIQLETHIREYKLKTMTSLVVAIALSPDHDLEQECRKKKSLRAAYQKLEDWGVPLPHQEVQEETHNFIYLVAKLLKGWDRWKTSMYRDPWFCPSLRFSKTLGCSQMLRLREAYRASEGNQPFLSDGNFYAAGDFTEFGLSCTHGWEIKQFNDGTGMISVEALHPPEGKEIHWEGQSYFLGADVAQPLLPQYQYQVREAGIHNTTGFLIPLKGEKYDFRIAKRVDVSEFRVKEFPMCLTFEQLTR